MSAQWKRIGASKWLQRSKCNHSLSTLTAITSTHTNRAFLFSPLGAKELLEGMRLALASQQQQQQSAK